MQVSGSRSRAQLITSLLAAPSFVGGLWIGATELRDAAAAPQPAAFESLADAIQHGEVEDAYTFISAGTDPNASIPFSDPQLTGGHPVMISPLTLAVSANRENTVMMLLSFGARLDLPQNELAPCVARHLGYDDLATMIIRDGKPSAKVMCPEPRVDAPAPLLGYVK